MAREAGGGMRTNNGIEVDAAAPFAGRIGPAGAGATREEAAAATGVATGQPAAQPVDNPFARLTADPHPPHPGRGTGDRTGDRTGDVDIRRTLSDQRTRARLLAAVAVAGWVVTAAGVLAFPPAGIALAALAALATARWRRCRRAVDAIARTNARP